ncbi:cysteine synthase [Trypanosoma rangeli]|uniref:Cysteine synthase n=1 Tax=Trypanosoma rangeli TaxID=5698 RepID=A0A3R7N9T2_TRYRA|nr:cysteine synthase [Trypanosoma rangeli]RNE99251.1 cysteine synthase [Trypanosoma rangeli]|eukprot:RNE99251.1 cysteine synthase [Trypanosoma rangeli]
MWPVHGSTHWGYTGGVTHKNERHGRQDCAPAGVSEPHDLREGSSCLRHKWQGRGGGKSGTWQERHCGSQRGNTGVALAISAPYAGNMFIIIVMLGLLSIERCCLMRIFGVELILTPAAFGVKGAMILVNCIVSTKLDAVCVDQFCTIYNAQIHQDTTGPEI